MESLRGWGSGHHGPTKQLAPRSRRHLGSTEPDGCCRAGAGSRPEAQLSATGATSDTEGLMTATIGSAVAAKVMGRITGPAGVNPTLAALTQAEQALAGPLNVAQVRQQNVAADLAERGSTVKYPAVNVYCEQIVKQMTEKFRTF